jgi:hypothetical protein
MNIFEIISVADKELTHSSLIKFLITQNNKIATDYFSIDNTSIEVKLEASETVVLKESNNLVRKKLRFDIVITSNNHNNPNDSPLMLIENKYKATPTVRQLDLYDRYVKEHIKTPLPKKVLMVFLQEQIPSDVNTYCIENDWEVKSYFSLSDKESSSLTGYLSNTILTFDGSADKLKNDFLLDEYKEYLNNTQNVLKKFLLRPDILTKDDFKIYREYKRNRDLWFKYLLYIQSLISIKVKGKETNSKFIFKSGNDGGGNLIPSVNFWFKETYYWGIDGDSMKIGFSYNHNDNIEAKKEKILFKLKNSMLFDSLVNKYGKLYNPAKKDKGGESVMSIASFNLGKWKNETKEEFVNDSSEIFIEYYKIINSLFETEA